MSTTTPLMSRSKKTARLDCTSSSAWVHQLGFWSAGLATLIGILYFVVILGLLVTGYFVFPPSEAVQLFGGITTLITAPILVVMVACVHHIAPPEKKIFSQVGLLFTVLFAGMVTINRFVQLGMVRNSVLTGETSGLERFLPYDSHSAMFALEMLGWAFFLGLAALFLAPVFSHGKIGQWIRWLFVSYGILGLISALGYLFNSPVSAIGFVAWGFVLYWITGLLALLFKRAGTHG